MRLADRGMPPVVVVARDVPEQRPVRPAVGVVDERQHGRDQALVGRRDEVAGAVLAQEVLHRRVVHGEVLRHVHRRSRRRSDSRRG